MIYMIINVYKIKLESVLLKCCSCLYQKKKSVVRVIFLLKIHEKEERMNNLCSNSGIH